MNKLRLNAHLIIALSHNEKSKNIVPEYDLTFTYEFHNILHMYKIFNTLAKRIETYRIRRKQRFLLKTMATSDDYSAYIARLKRLENKPGYAKFIAENHNIGRVFSPVTRKIYNTHFNIT